MAYEMYLQLLGRAGARQHSPQGKAPALGLTHNLGGIPNRNVAAIGIFGLMDV
jgi:acetyl-CoA C-acetyltransferase